MHIENLYRVPELLECYALEKVHGTSSHIAYRQGKVLFHAGGVSHQNFVDLFNEGFLVQKFQEKFLETDEVGIYGESFGGKLQGMSETYGKELRFLAFDVKINGKWLDVPAAEGLAGEFGIGFVPYERGPLCLSWLDEQRDKPSLVAVPSDKFQMREGIVIRPIHEMFYKDGSRVITKHKRPEFRETKSVRHVEVSAEEAQKWADAEAIAEEWVTPMRLQHVLQRVPFNSPKDIGNIIREMMEDVKREGGGEFEWSKDIGKFVGKYTVKLLEKIS